MKGKLARGVVWVTAARALINLIGLASTLLLARLLLPEDFGLVAIAMTFVAIVGAVTELSLSSALIQHENPTEEQYDTVFTLSAARAVIVGSIIAAAAWPMAWLYNDARVAPLLLAVAAVGTLSGFGNPRIAVFIRRLEFWQDFVFGVSSKLAGFLAAVLIAYIYRTYWALVIGSAVSQLLSLALSYLLYRQRPRFRIKGWRELMGFSIWLSLGQAVNTINWRSDSLLLGYFLGNRSLGFYSFGDNLASMPTREATAPIAQTLFPAFSRLQAEPARLRAAYKQSQAMLCAAALPLAFGFAMLAKPIVLAAVGAKWLPAVIVIQLLSGVFAVQTLASSVQPLAMALGETRLLFKRDVANLAIRLPLIVIGLAAAGLIGVVVARLFSGTISTVINMMLARRLLSLPLLEQLRANLRSFVATGAMCGALAVALHTTSPQGEGTDWVLLAALTVVGASTYVAALFGQWLAVGKPDGPEAELVSLSHRLTPLRLFRRVV